MGFFSVVTEDCYPYTSGNSQTPGYCHIPKTMLRDENPVCVNSEAVNRNIYKMTPPYRVSSREEDIMTEIITNGPVQATFLVHEDFFMYNSGVYRHTELADKKGYRYSASGYHSVRIIGWVVQTLLQPYNLPKNQFNACIFGLFLKLLSCGGTCANPWQPLFFFQMGRWWINWSPSQVLVSCQQLGAGLGRTWIWEAHSWRKSLRNWKLYYRRLGKREGIKEAKI